MIDLFIRRPVFTTMLVMLLVVFGLKCYPQLGIDLDPDVEFPIVLVNVGYTGASPEEMETLVTKIIEDAVSSVSGIKTLSSVSSEGMSRTTIEFEFGTDPKLAANEVREKVASVRRRLPDQVDEPTVQRYDITAQSIMNFSLSSEVRSRGELRKMAEDVVKDRLQQIEGVAQVDIYGASLREIQLLANPSKLEAYGVTLDSVLEAVNSNNVNTPGGRVVEAGVELTVRVLGRYKSIDDVKNITLTASDGRLIRMDEVVTVVDGWSEERNYAQTDGIASVVLAIQKQSGTNTVNVADKVVQAMENMQKNVLPPDVKVTIVLDNSTYIRDSVADVMEAMIFGGLLAVIITFLFLHDYRATIIGALAIPTSVIATFFMMKAMDFTLNNMSLMALSLSIGILIDDAIVIIENIHRHISQGKLPLNAASEGTREISLAVLATTFSILAVFVPVGTMGEITGQYFKQFGLTVAFAVAFSLFVAFSMTPMLSAYWLRPHASVKDFSKIKLINAVLKEWEKGFLFVREVYVVLLKWALEHPKKLLVIAVFSLLLNWVLYDYVGKESQPTYDSGEFIVNLLAPAGTSLERTKELVLPIDEEVRRIPELEHSYVIIGLNRQVYRARIGIRLVPKSERERGMVQIMDELRMNLRHVEGLKVSVISGQRRGRGDQRPVQVAIRGPELHDINQYAQQLAEMIKEIPGAVDVDTSSEQSEPEVQIRLDPVRMGELGIDAASAGKTIQIAFLGYTTTNKYDVADKAYDICVRLEPDARLSLSDVADFRISTKSGKFVRLGDIAKVKLSSGPTQIDREDRQRQVIVYANTVGTTPGKIVEKVNVMIPELNLPLGYSYKYVGQTQSMQKSDKEIYKALVLAVILIYMVLAAQFESFIHPFTIMLSLPFSLFGAIVGLLITNSTINIVSQIGVIMLMGLVTKNAILLVDYANQMREKHNMTVKDALMEAGQVRLRPILMTTMAMIFGMLPIALGIGAGAEMRSSMGVTVVGGLITSTILTLIVVPLFYLLVERMQNYFRKQT